MALDAPSFALTAAEIEHFLAVRAQSEALAAPLSPEDWMLQSMEEASPVKWNLAHTSWFFETFLLAPYLENYTPYHDGFGYLFNSYYNLVGDMHPRQRRGLLSRPTVDEVIAYRRHVTARTKALCEDPPEGRTKDISNLLQLGCAHEQQHQELLLTDLKHGLFQNPLAPAAYTRPAEMMETAPGPGVQHETPPLEWVAYDGGLTSVGAEAEKFAFDNEGPRHKVYIGPYALSKTLVTNREFIAFIDDGGYDDPQWWLSDGWALAQSEGWKAPLYWRCIDGAWRAFTLYGECAIDPSAPVAHISYYEAAAFAEWTGFRLPTEFEWENAVADMPVQGHFLAGAPPQPPRAANLFERAPKANHHDDKAGAAAAGIAQAYGDLWEWTASPYVAYPGYRAARGAIGEYNGKFMSSQMVLRGGSCATPENHIRASYRNFFPPDARWQFAGLRLARDL